jgi:predicted AAA+ superfamily ATPase
MRENIQYKRWLETLLPKPTARTLALITGARQTGKTTSARRCYPALRYLNLDAIEYRLQLEQVTSFGWGVTVGPAVLDEVQKLPGIFDKLKYAFDAHAIDFSVLLGSAQILLLRNVRETLAGRITVHELWPLMLTELVAGPAAAALAPPLLAGMLGERTVQTVCGAEPEVLLGNTPATLRAAEDYLMTWGGMPALLPLKEARRRAWLRSYELTYLERDLADLARLQDLAPFRRFQQLAAARSGQLLSYSELARDAGVGVETARRYLEYLRISYQAFLLQPYSRNLTSTLVKTPKLYWADMGLLRQATGVEGISAGALYESYVVSEIAKYLRTLQLDVTPYFYRTRSGMEVDLLLRCARGVLGLEIKARQQVAPTDATRLAEVGKALGREWLGGIVVYRGERIHALREGIWAVPSWRLLTRKHGGAVSKRTWRRDVTK